MSGVGMCRGAGPIASMWASRSVVLDGVGIGHATAGVLLGLCGLRAVPLVLLAVGWQLLEFALTACAPVGFMQPLAAHLKPSGGTFFLMLVGCAVGRLGHWLVRRQRDADLFADPSASSAVWPRRPEPVDSAAYDDVEASFFGGAQLDLDDTETDELRAALSYRLAELRKSADADGSQWERITVLESLLARLPPRRARNGEAALIAS